MSKTTKIMSLDMVIMALNDLAPLELCQRENRSFYCSQSKVEIGGHGILRSPTQSSYYAEAAVMEYWEELTNLAPGCYVVVNAMDPAYRRDLVWDGEKWVKKGSEGRRILLRSAKDMP